MLADITDDRSSRNQPQIARTRKIRRPRKTTAVRPAVASAGVYGAAAPKYLAVGWHPLPVAQGQKEGGLPVDRTGRGKPYATNDEIARWCRSRPMDNVCVRMMTVTVGGKQYDVVGIDVDDYTSGGKRKLGAKQLRELEREHGPLPATYSSGNRGVDAPSRIRFYLVPAGLHWRGKLAKDIDVISPGYRYAMVWPSKHPEGRDYVWVTPDGEQMDAGEVPDPVSLPILPDAWVELGTNGRMPDDGTVEDSESSVREIRQWWAERFPRASEPMCSKYEGIVDYWDQMIFDDADSHDKILNSHWNMLAMHSEGHAGGTEALRQVEAIWITDVKARGKRTLDEFRREIFRSRSKGMRKLKGQIDSGQRRITSTCGCVSDDEVEALVDNFNARMAEVMPPKVNALDAEAERAYRRRKADEIARQRLAVEAWTAPEDDGDLSHQIAHPEPDEGHLVEGLIRARGVVQINAQYKAGKTTLASVNLPKALVTGEPFLRHFDVEFGSEECVAVWNLEVDRQDLVDWLNEIDIPKEHQSRVFPICLRGNRSVDFRNPLAIDWAVNWLKDRRIAVWIIDPLSKLYRGEENSSTEFNAWWTTLEDIMRRAGVRVTVIVHHSGHGGEGRARGTSAMMGNPDALLEYRHSGDHGELPPNSKRYLKAFGRRVNQPEIRLDWDPATGQLYVDEGGGSRADDRKRTMAVKAWSALKTAPANQLPMNQGQLLEAMGRRAKGKNNKDAIEAIRYAEQHGWIAIDDGGTGKAKLHSLGLSAPLTDQKFAVTIGDDDGEADE